MRRATAHLPGLYTRVRPTHHQTVPGIRPTEGGPRPTSTHTPGPIHFSNANNRPPPDSRAILTSRRPRWPHHYLWTPYGGRRRSLGAPIDTWRLPGPKHTTTAFPPSGYHMIATHTRGRRIRPPTRYDYTQTITYRPDVHTHLTIIQLTRNNDTQTIISGLDVHTRYSRGQTRKQVVSRHFFTRQNDYVTATLPSTQDHMYIPVIR